jgi:hypothetical protein
MTTHQLLPEPEFEWCHSVYGNVNEVIPNDIPEPLGKPVITTTYTDANLQESPTPLQRDLEAQTQSTLV